MAKEPIPTENSTKQKEKGKDLTKSYDNPPPPPTATEESKKQRDNNTKTPPKTSITQ